MKTSLRLRAAAGAVLCLAAFGTSAARAADTIIAHPTAVVGSIGVMLQTFDISGLFEKIGGENGVIERRGTRHGTPPGAKTVLMAIQSPLSVPKKQAWATLQLFLNTDHLDQGIAVEEHGPATHRRAACREKKAHRRGQSTREKPTRVQSAFLADSRCRLDDRATNRVRAQPWTRSNGFTPNNLAYRAPAVKPEL